MALVSLVLAIGCCFLPTSPRWLLVRHRDRSGAVTALNRLNIASAEVEKDIMRSDFCQDSLVNETRTEASKIFSKQYRRRTILACFILGM